MQNKNKEKGAGYCPFCGHQLLEPGGEEAICSCYVCGNTYLIHTFPDNQYASKEDWYDIPGFLGIYQVSSHLRIRSLDRVSANGRRLTGRLMTTYPKNNEVYIALSKNCRQKEYNVQTLLTKAKQQKM